MVKLGGERRQRVARIERERGSGIELRVFQRGAIRSAAP
jgi:hypothetical protein